MAKKASRTKTRRAKPAAKGASDPARALREALLRLVSSHGWRELSLAAIADEAGLGLAEAIGIYPSKADILRGLSQALDAGVLKSLNAEPLEGSIRDRLFDLFMRRFDRMKADRNAYARLARELPWTPPEALVLAFRLRQSIGLMLETAGLSASGFAGMVRIEAAGGAYACALNAFFADESADLSATMAALDKALRRLECLRNWVRRKRHN
jgi:ubiquinone biosynthesis protein COQ9